MLGDILSFLFVMVFGGLATLVIGDEIGSATFLHLWQRNWLKAATIGAD